MTERFEQLSSPPGPGERRGAAAELAGRLAVSASIIALIYAVWMAYLPSAVEWTKWLARIFPRLSVFGLGAFVALTLQGCRTRGSVLLAGALTAGAGLFWLHFNTAQQFEIIQVATDAVNARGMAARDFSGVGRGLYFHAVPEMLQPGTVLLLMRFECAVFAAAFLGTWIGRGTWSPWHFVALVLAGAVCDFWLNWFHVAVRADGFSPMSVLRLPFFPAVSGIAPGPAITDLVFISAILESARAFRMHTGSLVVGAMAGYCFGGALGLEPNPGWTHLSMTLTACGIFSAAWPDLKLDSLAMGKLFLAVALLILMECSVIWVEHQFNPPPKKSIPDPEKLRNVAGGADFLPARNAGSQEVRATPSPHRNWQTLCVYFRQGSADKLLH